MKRVLARQFDRLANWAYCDYLTKGQALFVFVSAIMFSYMSLTVL
jgi:hypothetical protein